MPGSARPMPSTPASSRTARGRRQQKVHHRDQAQAGHRGKADDHEPSIGPGPPGAGPPPGRAAGRDLGSSLAGALRPPRWGRPRGVSISRRPRRAPLLQAAARRRSAGASRRRQAPGAARGWRGRRTPVGCRVREALRPPGSRSGRHLLDAAHEIEQGAIAELRGRVRRGRRRGLRLGDRTPEPVLLGAGDEVALQRQAAHRRAVGRDPDDRHDVRSGSPSPIEPLRPAVRDRDLRRARLGLHLEGRLHPRRGKDRGESPLGVGDRRPA